MKIVVNRVHRTEALCLLRSLPDSSIDMIYVDPPFGTGQRQVMSRKRGGATISVVGYEDSGSGYIDWLRTHVIEFRRILKSSGSLYLHLDHHWVHYAKVMCDEVFGRNNFLNEIIWSYNYGGRGKDRWPHKHDNILVYVKEHGKHVFNWDDIPRVPYAAPELQKMGRSLEEAQLRINRGQVPTDVWSLSIVGTSSKERNGYPTQKPIKLIERAILASSTSESVVLDCFAGSGSTGASALKHGRSFIMCDPSQSAIDVMKKRFTGIDVEWVENDDLSK